MKNPTCPTKLPNEDEKASHAMYLFDSTTSDINQMKVQVEPLEIAIEI
jgi:hypothetical protein